MGLCNHDQKSHKSFSVRSFSPTSPLPDEPRPRPCRSRFSSPTYPRTRGRYFASPPVSESRRTSSSRQDFRPRTAHSAAPGWITSPKSRSRATPIGRRSRAWRKAEDARVLLFTTRACTSYLDHAFRSGDVLLFGRESSGVPGKVHAAADVRLVIPIRAGLRSLNVAIAAAMATGEAVRQTGAMKRKNTRRVKDNLTPLGAALHPPRSLALVADSRLPIPHASGGDITLPDIPHDANVYRNNGKKEPAENFPLCITAECIAHAPRWYRRACR